MPLIVMLHGCTQSPEEFALGTRMNALPKSSAA
jgi:poly(3-hydroxybutyrate) depolymerase